MWCLAVDGGGSSTRMAFADDASGRAGAARSGPSNMLVVGRDRAEEAMGAVLAALPVAPRGIAGAVIGLAGADRPEVRDHWRRFFQDRGFPRVWVVGDYRLAWAALAGGNPGTVAVLGTGSIVYGEGGAEKLRAGGYGWRLEDVGSGLWLGTKAVQATLAEWDGVGPSTALSRLVAERFGMSRVDALLSWWYGPAFDARQPADLAAEVLALAATDAVAHRLAREGACRVCDLIESVTARLAGADGWPVGLAGGLAGRWRPWIEREWWSRPAGGRIAVVQREPVAGGVLLAQRWAKEGRPSDAG